MCQCVCMSVCVYVSVCVCVCVCDRCLCRVCCVCRVRSCRECWKALILAHFPCEVHHVCTMSRADMEVHAVKQASLGAGNPAIHAYQHTSHMYKHTRYPLVIQGNEESVHDSGK